jgi:MFS family permease
VSAVPRRQFYGWKAIVPAVFVILLTTNGLTVGGIAAFDPYLVQDLGVARADIKLGDAIQLGVTAGLGLVCGWLVDRFGVRIVMAIGIAALAGGFFQLATVDTLTGYYLSRLLMGLGLSGAGLAICVVAVSRWFALSRGLALGIVLAGTSFGNAFFPRVFTGFIGSSGWQNAAGYAGWMLLGLAPLILWVIKEWPQVMGLEPYGAERIAKIGLTSSGRELSYREILARADFWFMGIAAFCTFYSILAVNNNMILHMLDLGAPPEVGSLIAIPLFLAGLVGKLASGWLTDLFGRKSVWLVSLAFMLVAAASLTLMNVSLVTPAAILMGLGWGANYTLLQAIAGDLFGTRSLGRVMGAVTVLDAGGGALGPWVTARLADASGNYQSGFALVSTLIAVAFVMAALLRIESPDVAARQAGV